jgi:hypothetical protein
MLKNSQINAVLNYAETVIAVNPDAEQDIDVLLERLNDEFNIEHMPKDSFRQVVDAVACRFFFSPNVTGPAQLGMPPM